MKDLPPIVWILGVFVFFAILIGIYSSSRPDPIPPARSAWTYVEQFRKDIEFRRKDIRPGMNQELIEVPYRVVMERLSDVSTPQVLSRYVIHIYPSGKVPMDRPWFGSGADILLVDSEPKEGIGKVRMVAMRRVEQLKE